MTKLSLALALPLLLLAACGVTLPTPGSVGLPQPPTAAVVANPSQLDTASLCEYADYIDGVALEWHAYIEDWAAIIPQDQVDSLTGKLDKLLDSSELAQSVIEQRNVLCTVVLPPARPSDL